MTSSMPPQFTVGDGTPTGSTPYFLPTLLRLPHPTDFRHLCKHDSPEQLVPACRLWRYVNTYLCVSHSVPHLPPLHTHLHHHSYAPTTASFSPVGTDTAWLDGALHTTAPHHPAPLAPTTFPTPAHAAAAGRCPTAHCLRTPPTPQTRAHVPNYPPPPPHPTLHRFLPYPTTGQTLWYHTHTTQYTLTSLPPPHPTPPPHRAPAPHTQVGEPGLGLSPH